MDEHGKFFNVEVQTESSGAPPQRARYYTGMEELRNEGMQQGIQQGIKQGNKQGMQKFADLTKKLLALHRTNDLNRATEDEQYRDQLMKELAIQ